MSWFSKKSKNRRLARQHVLDVKLRSSQVRAARARFAAIGLGSFFAVVLSGYLLWCAGDWALDNFVYRNRAFAIEHIDISTDGVLSQQQLQRWAGVKLQDNLLALDLSRVRRDLKLVPSIGSVFVDRVLPNTLCIRVTEREPIAEIRVARPRPAGGLDLVSYQIDPEGYVMLSLEPTSATPAPVACTALPEIKGIDSNELVPGRRIESPRMEAALRLLIAFERSTMSGLVDLREIDVSDPDALVATTDQKSVITFGLADVEQQLRRWRMIHDTTQKAGKLIGTLDLAVTNYVPICFLESAPPPVPNSKSPKTVLPRKKHV
jgi:cell division septal protein FtsQ